ncbi:MAG: hypothetical protein M3N93_12485 [Acidobacteriota bacterium]|nr:hypothetical protein [Acidobacteriota bacterium]
METRKHYAIAVCLLLGAFAGASCRGKHDRVDAGPVSSFSMNDANAAGQLLSGFYGVEANSWRWTGKTFSILLRTPSGGAQRGGNLSFTFTIPDVSLQQLKTLRLSASTNGMMLKAAEYSTSGVQTFTADVPASLLTADTVRIDFELDKSVPPAVDRRELGVVANSVGLAAK